MPLMVASLAQVECSDVRTVVARESCNKMFSLSWRKLCCDFGLQAPNGFVGNVRIGRTTFVF